MGYLYNRYARRIDADAIELISPSNERLLLIDNTAANITRVYGHATSTHQLYLYGSKADSRPYVRLVGNDEIVIDSAVQTQIVHAGGASHIFKLGTHFMKETATPTPIANSGCVYCKNDNELYFQTGAGVEKTVTTV